MPPRLLVTPVSRSGIGPATRLRLADQDPASFQLVSRSVLPSPSNSAASMGWLDVASPVPQFWPTSAPLRQVNTENWAVKFAVVGPLSVVTASVMPSPLKSPNRRLQVEQAPAGFTDVDCARNLAPVERYAVTFPFDSSLTASSRPSPLRSPATCGMG